MITDLAQKYAPRLKHWPTWLIDDEAFAAFLAENHLNKEVTGEPEDILTLRNTVSSRKLTVPQVVISELREALLPGKTYDLRMPSPLRLRKIRRPEELEDALREFWLELYFANPAKSKELKLSEALPGVVLESHITGSGSISPVANLGYFPVNFDSFLYADNYYICNIKPLTQSDPGRREEAISRPAGPKIISGVPLSPGIARGQWLNFSRADQQLKDKIVVLATIGNRDLAAVLSSHPKGLIYTAIPKRDQILRIKYKGIPAIYIASRELHLKRNRFVTVNGSDGTLTP